MFGYIVPFVPELKIREFEQFRTYYCGLCRTLKDRYGKCDVLNYDAVFLYVLSEGFVDGQADMTPSKCIVHPFRRRDALKTSAAGYAADINMLMAYAKARDDTNDNGGVKAAVRHRILKRHFARAQTLSPEAAEDMRSAMEQMECIEKTDSSDVDAAAEPYGLLLGGIFADVHVLQSHILHDLGYNLGRWVYLIDAYDDMAEDARRGQFNVFVNRAKQHQLSLDDMRDSVRFSLLFTLSQAANALQRLDLKKNRELLTNIVRLGLLAQTESVLSGKGRIGQEPHRLRPDGL